MTFADVLLAGSRDYGLILWALAATNADCLGALRFPASAAPDANAHDVYRVTAQDPTLGCAP